MPETITGTVTRVFFCNLDSPWMSGALQTADGDRRFAGAIAADQGDLVELNGDWVTDPKWGQQFKVESGLVKLDETPDSLAELLAKSPEFKGIGHSRARAIVDAATHLADGRDLSETLIADAERISEMSGVRVDLVVEAARIWSEKKEHFDALASLVDQGWTNTQAGRIVNALGANAPALLRGDPYMLIGKIKRFGFKTVDAVAQKMGISKGDPKRLAAGVGFCLDRHADRGHTWTTREALAIEAMSELEPDTLRAEELVHTVIEKLINSGVMMADESPLGEEVVASTVLAKREFRVFQQLIQGLSVPILDIENGSIRFDGERTQAILPTLNEGQRLAVWGIWGHRYAVLSGSAGVGKTYTVRSVVEIAEENGLNVALCAPTGKAARRLSHATGKRATTKHRLLEPRFENGEFHFSRHGGNPLDEFDLVIVDEASMSDIRLMASLLDALTPTCRLLLVGDHHQIPSVGAGAVLRDILGARDRFAGAVHVLTEVVRQAGDLERNTNAVLDGVVVPQQCPAWRLQKTTRGDENGAGGIVAMIVEKLATDGVQAPFGRELDLAWDIQVLSPMKKGPLGTWALNAHLQRLRQRLLGNPPPPPTEENKAPKPLPGDRVIWTKNDYELDLFNGTQAIVMEIRKGGAMKLFVEDGREVVIPPAKRLHVELAYAMTIHKAQGSEWPCVVLVGSIAHKIMHDRNLLYTGASRASECLVIVGDMAGLKMFANTRKSERRQTFGSFMVHGWCPIAWQVQDPQPIAVEGEVDTTGKGFRDRYGSLE